MKTFDYSYEPGEEVDHLYQFPETRLTLCASYQEYDCLGWIFINNMSPMLAIIPDGSECYLNTKCKWKDLTLDNNLVVQIISIYEMRFNYEWF